MADRRGDSPPRYPWCQRRPRTWLTQIFVVLLTCVLPGDLVHFHYPPRRFQTGASPRETVDGGFCILLLTQVANR